MSMYPGISRTRWQQPTHTKCASPPPRWGFSLQEQQWDWTKDTSNGVDDSQDQRVYIASPTYCSELASTPLYVWTDESQHHQFLPSPTYPLSLMADSDLYVRGQETQLPIGQQPQAQTTLRRSKQTAVGRWNSEEHQWFLKGLEVFQGPAWGEMARLIGTRTPTQVRTHAQKFFSKLARFNQTMPYFEAQIQKERARLMAQGATAQSASLSPVPTVCQSSDSRRTRPSTSATAAQARYPQKTYDIKPRSIEGVAPFAAKASTDARQ